MKRLLVAGAAGVALTTAALPAHAYPNYDYEGGCGFDTVNDTTPGGILGGPDRFIGAMYVAVAATDSFGIPVPTATISVDCEIYVNGVLTDVAMSASGVGAAAAAGTFSFDAGFTDVVTMCERVVVDGEEMHDCYLDEPNFPPRQVQGLLNLANEMVFEPIVDPLVCPPLSDNPVWDCPPYDD